MTRCAACHRPFVDGQAQHYMACPNYRGPLRHEAEHTFFASWRFITYCTCGKVYAAYQKTGLAAHCPDRDVKER